MTPLFLAGHPALDFLNTWLAPQGQEAELIDDGRAYLDWLVAAGLLDERAASAAARRLGAEALDRAAAEARSVREWVRVWLSRWREVPEEDRSADIDRLNRLLARGSFQREVLISDAGPRLVERCRVGGADELIALPAAAIAELFASQSPALVKQCAGAACTLWFLDRTKAHRRVFCSAAVCGNRAKVAAFRERQRAR